MTTVFLYPVPSPRATGLRCGNPAAAVGLDAGLWWRSEVAGHSKAEGTEGDDQAKKRRGNDIGCDGRFVLVEPSGYACVHAVLLFGFSVWMDESLMKVAVAR